ncbi:MAG: hypothetical protein GDA48_16080 [Hormoscilla sp. GM102CHS1]|nr:hypothetical protein [Hormoscilla sp. GM102CHS1]
MPVKIELLANYQLRTKSGDPTALELPVIEFAPDGGNNTPYISSVSISVQGEPAGLANMIQFAYREVPANKPIKLRTPQRVKRDECRLPGPSLPDANCLLEVKVEYFDSDAEGQPNRSEVKSVTASCKIVSRAVPETGNPDPPERERTTVQSGETNQMEKFAGWLAIDFGTSNSTVTLYDARFAVQLDSLPREQEQKLRARLAQWFNDRPLDPRPGVRDRDWDEEWEKLISEVSKEFSDLDNDSQENIGDRIFKETKSSRLLEAISLVELGLNNRREWFRRSASKGLNQIYHEVFRVPSLEWQRLIPVELDGLRKLSEIPSELEIESLDDGGLKVLMGERAKQNRLEAIAQGQDIKGKFHHSPKRYFGQNLENQKIQVTLNGSSQSVAVEGCIPVWQ